MLAGPAGGSLLDVGCYCVSVALLLGGRPTSVFAEQVVREGGCDVRMTGILRLARGALAQFDCALDAPQRELLEIVGSEGTITFTDPWAQRRDASVRIVTADGDESIEFGVVDAYRLQLENVNRAVQGTELPLVGSAESVEVAEVIEALAQSAIANQPVLL